MITRDATNVKMSALRYGCLHRYFELISRIEIVGDNLEIELIVEQEDLEAQVEALVDYHLTFEGVMTNDAKLCACSNFGRHLMVQFGGENTQMVIDGTIAYDDLFEMAEVLAGMMRLIPYGYLQMAIVYIDTFADKYAAFASKPYFDLNRRTAYRNQIIEFLGGL